MNSIIKGKDIKCPTACLFQTDIEGLKSFVEKLTLYKTLLETENQSITSIDTQAIFDIQQRKIELLAEFSDHEISIITLLESLSKKEDLSEFSPQLQKAAQDKVGNLLENIQRLYKINLQLLKSLEQHTSDLIETLNPGNHQSFTYANIRKKR